MASFLGPLQTCRAHRRVGVRRVLNFQRCCASGADGQLRPGSIKSILCFWEQIRRDGASYLPVCLRAAGPGHQASW